MEIGGTGRVEGKFTRQEGETGYVIMIPGDDTSALDRFSGDFSDAAKALIADAYGEAMVTQIGRSGFCFNAIPPGTFTIRAYVLRERDEAYQIRGSKTFDMEPGEVVTLDLP
jgi:hypothetical protein